MKYIKKFNELGMQDIALVGGKNASLGQMITHISSLGAMVPMGYAITADAYWYYVKTNNLEHRMREILATLSDHKDLAQLERVGSAIRTLFEQGAIPADLAQEIVDAYHDLSSLYGERYCDVAVRSSATAEDLPTASFAGQQESYLNVRGDVQVLGRYQKCLASLFTNRAISYRVEQGFDHMKIALSVGIQKMIRSDIACSGVAFSLDTDSGFKDMVLINASWGLGENIVKGLVIPDEYGVFKPTFLNNHASLIKKQLGDKRTKMIYTSDTDNPTQMIQTNEQEQRSFCLSNEQILHLAGMILRIEEHYSALKGSWCPMDIEWAQDGVDKKLYIIQARPETVHASAVDKKPEIVRYYSTMDLKPPILVTGQSIGQEIVAGSVRIISSVNDIDQIKEGEILVTAMTDPDWVPAMKKASGIITDRGGRTCHAAIVSRELGIPALIGTHNATEKLKTGNAVTVDCSQGSVGYVYEGIMPYRKEVIALDEIPHLATKILVNIADPDTALSTSMLPVDGVGLARLEFIISNVIKVHPMALLHPEKIADNQVRSCIDAITAPYHNNARQFFVDSLAYGIGMIAAAFYPRSVIVRTSDFKTNEYRNLIGGSYFEQEEENPMIGFRGASRYYNERYREAFELECAALKKVREDMGLVNVKIMVPFVRTCDEAARVVQELNQHGLRSGERGLEIIMMCEIPSNVILIEQFSSFFDGFSIGSNDLTQLTLGVDRDAEMLSQLFDERDPAVKKMIDMAIKGAHSTKKTIGICGQAPSDYPEFAEYLMQLGIDSISLNPDSVVPFLMRAKGNTKKVL